MLKKRSSVQTGFSATSELAVAADECILSRDLCVLYIKMYKK
jgi:hypothetical protein